jgi:hypothetical protein
MSAAMLKAIFGVSLLSISIATGELRQESHKVVNDVTPIEKVIVLLKDLQARVEKEGAKEATQYEKYSCFCKDQAKFKQDAIDKSTEKIEVLEVDIADMEAAIMSSTQTSLLLLRTSQLLRSRSKRPPKNATKSTKSIS